MEYSESGMRVSGLVAPPRAARASRSMQYFYVNGRYVKSRTMVAALENAFRGLLMGGRFPGCVLMLELPAGAVDVNVHPAKTEVRFARESDVFNVIYRGVKNAVMKADGLSGSLSLEGEKAAAKKQQPQGVQVSFSTLPLQETEEQNAPSGQTKTAVQQPVNTAAAPKPAAAPVITAPQPHPAAAKPRSIDSVFASFAEPEALEVADSIDTPPVRAEDALRPSVPVRGFARNPFAGLDITVDEDDVPAVRPVKQEEKETPAVQQSADTGAQKQRDASPAAEPALPQTAPEEDSVRQAKQFADELSASAAVPPGDDLTIVGEVFKTYILAQRGEELCFIDKHAAHERIIYEGLAAGYGSVAGQLLLMPVTVELSAEEKTALLAQQDYLENIGLSLDDFGGRSVLVREVPADIRVESVEDLVQEIAARLAAGQKEPLAEKTAWVLHSIACRAAIKGGDTTHYPEMLRLARDILDGSVPPFCPHGRPVILRITRKELEKQFGRLG